VIPKLEKMGFAPQWFVGAVTSGEVTQDMLQRRPGDFWQGLGSRCLHITWGARGAVSLDGLGLQVTSLTSPVHTPGIVRGDMRRLHGYRPSLTCRSGASGGTE
jgi:hypothetical protein